MSDDAKQSKKHQKRKLPPTEASDRPLVYTCNFVSRCDKSLLRRATSHERPLFVCQKCAKGSTSEAARPQTQTPDAHPASKSADRIEVRFHCCFKEEMVWQKFSKGLCRGTKEGIASDTLWDTHIRVPKRVTNSPWSETAKTTLLKSKNIFQTIQDKRATLGTECICLLSASVSSSFKNRCDTPCEAHFACHKVCHGVFFKNRERDMRTTQCICTSSFKIPMVTPYQLHQGV